MFKGEHEHSMDEKSRVVLPAGLRKDLSDATLAGGFTLVSGDDQQCLELHSTPVWEAWIRKQQSLYRPDNLEAKEYFRSLMSTANDIKLDRNFRFVIPDSSKELAGLVKDVVFVGVMDYVEIWDKEGWLERKKGRADRLRPPPVDREEPGAIPLPR